MDVDDLLKGAMNSGSRMDYHKYLINLLSYHIINQSYLKAILEAQVEILARVNDIPNIDFSDMDLDEYRRMIEDKIDEVSDIEFVDAIHRIMKKD